MREAIMREAAMREKPRVKDPSPKKFWFWSGWLNQGYMNFRVPFIATHARPNHQSDAAENEK